MSGQQTDETPEFESLLEFIKESRGFDYSGYKRPTLLRRIEKRIGTVGADGIAGYREYLASEPDEFAELFNTILINVTDFFRDPQAWEYVAGEIIPRIVESTPSGKQVRVWSTGCATGEEAYTAAMLIAEAIGEDEFRQRVKIYATDIDEDALNTGRHARYPRAAVEDVPEGLREKYFEGSEPTLTIRGDLRRAVIFGRHDLLNDPPISRVDLLLARNTLMYFTAEAQRKVLSAFHFSLTGDGFLFLGKSEVLLSRTNLFVPVDLKRRVFAPTPKIAFRDRLLSMVHEPEPAAVPDFEAKARDTAFDASPVAQLVVDGGGTLTLANMQARLLFNLAARDVGRPFRDLEMSYRPAELRSRIDDIRKDGRAVALRDVELTSANGERRQLDIHLAPLHTLDGRLFGTMISALDVTRFRSFQDSAERSREALETAYEELQSTTEELETTNEELQSTNEELETTNEELQSTNEELETMNEELQSTNEELATINDELRQRTDELNTVNVFLDAILTSLHSGVVVLDHDLRVRAWNAAAEELWGLRADEAEGQYFFSLDIGLPVDDLSKPLRALLMNGGGPTELTVGATNRRGRPIDVMVRLASTTLFDAPGVIVLMEDHEPGVD